tara:strand:+ start:222 stop:413 length:192 start_codon:yes stop_codon:yes gene_type:complete
MAERLITAVDMANATGIDPKKFRQALRQEQLPWHGHNDPWVVPIDSPKHRDMQRVMRKVIASG